MPLRADLLNPIPGGNPSGANLRYDPVVEKIKEARREDDEGDQGAWQTARKTADYPQVVKLAGDVLAKKSKDLQLAAWLVEAQIRREGLNVVGDCFKFIREFVDTFWDTFYPEIEDGEVDLRAGPLIWVGNKLDLPIKLAPITQAGFSFASYQESRKIGTEAEADTYEKQQARNAAIAAGKVTAEQFDEAVEATGMGFYANTLSSVNTALAEMRKLQDFCEDKFASLGDDAPSFTGTKKALEDVGHLLEVFLRRKGGAVPVAGAEEEEEPEPEPEPVSSGRSSLDDGVGFAFDSSMQSAPAAVAEPDSDGAAVAVQDDDDAPAAASVSAEPQSEQDVVQLLSNVCKYLRSADPQDVSPYLVMRAYRWGKLRTNTPPIAPEALIPPPTELRVKLKTLYKNGDWTSLLDATEEALAEPCSGAWIDLHRYAVLALEQNGLTPMAAAIKTELRGLLRDLPELKTATLMDDTAALSAETAAWVNTDVLVEESASSGAASLNGSSSAAASSSATSGSNDWLSNRDSTFVLDPSSKANDPNWKPDSDSSDSDSSFDSSSSDSDSSTDTLSVGDDSSSDTTTTTDAAPEVAPMEFPPIDEHPPMLAELPPDLIDDNRDLFEVACDRVKAGNHAEGLKLITEKLANEKSNRGRFRRRSQIAHLLLEGGHSKVAESLLAELTSEIENRRLDDWEESEAIAYPLELLLRCIAANSEQADKRTEVYARLCKLDPVRAIAITF